MPKNEVHPNWSEGNYAASLADVISNLERHGSDMSNITLTKCWFDDIPQDGEIFVSPRIVVIDSDLYESCVDVLKFIGPRLIHGTIIIFDDWFAYDADPREGEQRAWYEYLKDHRYIQYETLFNFGKYGKAIRITEK